MDYNHFFVNLPSDASMEAHPENQGGEYAVDLPEELALSPHQWEVALVQMTFNQDWNPMIPEDLWVAMCMNSAEGGKWVNCQSVHADIKAGQEPIENVSQLWEKILKPLIEKAGAAAKVKAEGLTLVVDKETKRLSITGKLVSDPKAVVRMELSTSLIQMLGFTRSQLTDSRYFQTAADSSFKTAKTHFEPNLKRGIASLWIYTDIIANQITGDTMAPLLRVIPVDPNLGNDVSRVVEFKRDHFCPLQAGNIRTVKISIRNTYGLASIQFATPVICKLMFRRKKVV